MCKWGLPLGVRVGIKKESRIDPRLGGVIPEGFEPPIFWAVTRGIIQLCYGTKPF